MTLLFVSRRVLLLAMLLFLTGHSYASESEIRLHSTPVLTIDIAQRMAMTCIERQRSEERSAVAVAIYDTGANPILLLKMDGVGIGSVTTAMQKAESSARFPFSGAEMANWVRGNASVGHVEGLLGVRGGLPIISNEGVHLGGIGVSGAPSEEDESCAAAGIEAVRPFLTL